MNDVGDDRDLPNDPLQAAPILVSHSLHNVAPEPASFSDAPIYQPTESGWQQATDYTYACSERSSKRRRITGKTRIPQGRPPDPKP